MAGAYLQRGVSTKYNIQEVIFKSVVSVTLRYASIFSRDHVQLVLELLFHHVKVLVS